MKSLNNDHKCQKNWKKGKFCKKKNKNAKIRGVETLKNIPLYLETIQ